MEDAGPNRHLIIYSMEKMYGPYRFIENSRLFPTEAMETYRKLCDKAKKTENPTEYVIAVVDIDPEYKHITVIDPLLYAPPSFTEKIQTAARTQHREGSRQYLDNLNRMKLALSEKWKNRLLELYYAGKFSNISTDVHSTMTPADVEKWMADNILKLQPQSQRGGRARLDSLTVAELRERCVKRKIKHSGLKKAELIAALRR